MVFLFLAPTYNLPAQTEQDGEILQRWLHGTGKSESVPETNGDYRIR